MLKELEERRIAAYKFKERKLAKQILGDKDDSDENKNITANEKLRVFQKT